VRAHAALVVFHQRTFQTLPENDDFRNRLDTVLVEIGEFNNQFVTQATEFLVAKLYEWGFERKESQE
jgi:hypothetical protein